MAEQRETPTVPPPSGWAKIVKKADGTQAIEFSDAFYKFLVGERGRVRNVNSGVDALAAAQVTAQANTQAQIAAANQAAQAAIAASGSATTDYDDFSEQTVASDAFTTFATCNITTDGTGDYDITAGLVVTAMSSSPAVIGGSSFAGAWQIIENPNAHVLASGTFTVTSTPFNEAGVTFYENIITFGTDLPAGDTYPDNETGATTIELQLKRASGTTSCSLLSGSLLTEWA